MYLFKEYRSQVEQKPNQFLWITKYIQIHSSSRFIIITSLGGVMTLTQATTVDADDSNKDSREDNPCHHNYARKLPV
jgi:hypothetical protein